MKVTKKMMEDVREHNEAVVASNRNYSKEKLLENDIKTKEEKLKRALISLSLGIELLNKELDKLRNEKIELNKYANIRSQELCSISTKFVNKHDIQIHQVAGKKEGDEIKVT